MQHLKFFLIISIFLAAATNSYSQFLLSYSQPSSKSIKSIEKAFHSVFKKNDPKVTVIIGDDYIPGTSRLHLMQPITYIRSASWLLPGCKIEYYLTPKDSVVKLITYDCTIKTNSTKIRDKEKKIFDVLYKDITMRLGNPVMGGYEPVVTTSEQLGTITDHRIRWKKGDTTVELTMAWTGNNTVVWTRINVYWI